MFPAVAEPYTLSRHDALPIPAPNDVQNGWTDLSCRPRVKSKPNAVITPTLKSSRPDSAYGTRRDRKSIRLNSSHRQISYAVICLKRKLTRPGSQGRDGELR